MNVICLLIAHRWTRVRPPDVASEETYLVCRRCGRQKYDVGPPIGAVGIGQHTL